MTKDTAPDASMFRLGDVWLSPWKSAYRVTHVNAYYCQADLRSGEEGRGKLIHRNTRDLSGPGSTKWTRISWGGQP